MSAELDDLQSRMKSHFASLCEARRADGLPVFALEHGLDAMAISSISAMLKAQLRVRWATLDMHWLLWVVWATEQGYDYDDGEYWHTFERRMKPCPSVRYFIRGLLVRTHLSYSRQVA